MSFSAPQRGQTKRRRSDARGANTWWEWREVQLTPCREKRDSDT